ncbi:hypothetical protein BH24DEI2_BH24DEI2_14830 [soil metagenome]
MSLLFRVGLVWIVFGLVAGLLLRGTGWRRGVAFGFSFVPLFGHLLYLVAYTLRGAVNLGTELVVFLGIALVLAVVVGMASWRYTTRKPGQLALVPLGLALVYAAPLLGYSSVLQTDTLRLDSISVVVFVGATLFVSSALATYAAGRRAREADLAVQPRRKR